MEDSEILQELRRLETIIMKRKHDSSTSGGRADESTTSHSPPRVDDPPSATPPRKKRRRIIYSDSSDHESENENLKVPQNGSASNDDDIGSVLGEDPTLSKDFGETIHATLAVRWNNILQKGLKKDIRSELIKKYLPPENCSFILPPKLNDEIKAAVQENAIKRDIKLEQKQVQLGAGITCIGRAIDAALKIPDKTLRDHVVKHLGDSGQILADLHYLESITRRSLLVQGLNKSTKEAIKDLSRDKLLFGEGLPEKLKAVKACSKSAADIKMKQQKPSTSRAKGDAKASTSTSAYNAPETLNWRGSSRRSAVNAAAVGAFRERRALTTAPRRPQTNQRPPAKRT